MSYMMAQLLHEEPDHWAAVVAKLDALSSLARTDPERAHGDADVILLTAVPREVREAYMRLEDAAPWWAGA